MVALPVLIASMCYSVAEAMAWRSGLHENPWEAKPFYVLISSATFAAAALNFIRINPVTVLYWSQVLAGVLTVPILIFVLIISNDKRVMSTPNTWGQNFWIGAAAGAVICAGTLCCAGRLETARLETDRLFRPLAFPGCIQPRHGYNVWAYDSHPTRSHTVSFPSAGAQQKDPVEITSEPSHHLVMENLFVRVFAVTVTQNVHADASPWP